MSKPKHADQWLQIHVGPPHDRHHWVAVLALIRDNKTGEVREYPTHEILAPDEDHPNTFGREEGNFSCDCNRRLFFNDHEVEDDANLCGGDAYSVNLINPANGVCYYKEFETAAQARGGGHG